MSGILPHRKEHTDQQSGPPNARGFASQEVGQRDLKPQVPGGEEEETGDGQRADVVVHRKNLAKRYVLPLHPTELVL